MFFSRPTLVALTLAFIPATSFAGYEWGFANVSLNRLFWTNSTKEKSTKIDFNYFELEGGGQYSWGELYGFFDIENIGHDGNEVRTAAKGVARYYLGKSNVSLYAHVYDFNAAGFSEQNRVFGLGYQLTGLGWWVKPFLGVHDVTQTYFTGLNGFMGGWTVGYTFKIGKLSFMATDWHELEFARKDAYAAANGGKNVSQNGAASLWWNATDEFTLGAQWRYAVDKLGTAGVLGAAILTARYNF